MFITSSDMICVLWRWCFCLFAPAFITMAKKAIDAYVFRLLSLLPSLDYDVRDYCQDDTKIVHLRVLYASFSTPSISLF